MVQIGRRGTVRRLFKNLKNCQKSQNLNFKILVHHFLCLCLLCIVKKFHSIRTKLTEEIHFEVCPYRHNASMYATPPSNAMRPPPALRARCNHQCAVGIPIGQRTTPFAARYHIGALQRGTFKNSTLVCS